MWFDIQVNALPISVDRHEQLSITDFIDQYLKPNKPVLFGPHLTKSWPVFQRWLEDVMNSNLKQPRFEWLQQQFGQIEVKVTLCPSLSDTDVTQTWPVETMLFSEFIQHWQTGKRYYLKDWHFQRTFPNEPLYTTPPPFQDDWLNYFWDRRKDVEDDYRFVYMGGDGTWTPLHVDVFQSYSWSANICGRKRWILFPPGQERYLQDRYGQFPMNVHFINLDQFPHAKQAKCMVFIQEPGETFFVPTGWYHQVENMGDTISINHNWANSSNLLALYECLIQDTIQVKHALSDCIDMENFEEHCQMILRLHSGWNLNDFADMLCIMSQHFLNDTLNEAEQYVKLWTCQRLKQVIQQLSTHDGLLKDRKDRLIEYNTLLDTHT